MTNLSSLLATGEAGSRNKEQRGFWTFYKGKLKNPMVKLCNKVWEDARNVQIIFSSWIDVCKLCTQLRKFCSKCKVWRGIFASCLPPATQQLVKEFTRSNVTSRLQNKQLNQGQQVHDVNHQGKSHAKTLINWRQRGGSSTSTLLWSYRAWIKRGPGNRFSTY